jgi:hypothetical protein
MGPAAVAVHDDREVTWKDGWCWRHGEDTVTWRNNRAQGASKCIETGMDGGEKSAGFTKKNIV